MMEGPFKNQVRGSGNHDRACKCLVDNKGGQGSRNRFGGVFESSGGTRFACAPQVFPDLDVNYWHQRFITGGPLMPETRLASGRQ